MNNWATSLLPIYSRSDTASNVSKPFQMLSPWKRWLWAVSTDFLPVLHAWTPQVWFRLWHHFTPASYPPSHSTCSFTWWWGRRVQRYHKKIWVTFSGESTSKSASKFATTECNSCVPEVNNIIKCKPVEMGIQWFLRLLNNGVCFLRSQILCDLSLIFRKWKFVSLIVELLARKWENIKWTQQWLSAPIKHFEWRQSLKKCHSLMASFRKHEVIMSQRIKWPGEEGYPTIIVTVCLNFQTLVLSLLLFLL